MLGQLFLKSNWKFITKPLAKKMQAFSLYGILNALGSQLAYRIDILMVAMLVAIDLSGVYAICNFITEVISKPARGLINIAAPIISESWKENNLAEIKMIYQKSSLNLLIIGLFVFLGIWLSLDDLFLIMPEGETMAKGKYVVFFLSMAKLVDMATSVNSDIIGFSKYFRFNFYVLLILAVLNIIFNYTFIPLYQITGAAIATFCSISLFNLAKLIFIWWKFKMQPFTMSTLLVFGIATLTYSIVFYLPLTSIPLLNILLRSFLVSVIYLSLIYFLKPSPDLNGMLEKFLKNFFKN